MVMPVVDIRKMRVVMPECRVMMRMGMRFGSVTRRVMLMLMMGIMHMFVRMFHRLMDMIVLVPFGQVQPHAQPHQSDRNPKCR